MIKPLGLGYHGYKWYYYRVMIIRYFVAFDSPQTAYNMLAIIEFCKKSVMHQESSIVH